MDEKKIVNKSIGEEKCQVIYTASRDALMTLEPPLWKFTSGNPAAVQMFKARNEEEFLSYEPWRLSPEFQMDGRPSSEKAKEMIEKAMKDGINLFEWNHKRINGEEFLAEVLLSKIEIGDQSFLNASVRDITDRKNLEKQLAKSYQERQMVLDSIPAWIFYKDDKNNFIYVNKAFADVMGKSKEELDGKSLFDIFPKEQAEAYWEDDKKVIASGVPKRNIIESMNSPKGLLWVQTDKIPYRNENGQIIGVIGFTIDITLRKKEEDEIAISNQKLEEMNKLMVGRELEMIKLKKEIENLKNQKT